MTPETQRTLERLEEWKQRVKDNCRPILYTDDCVALIAACEELQQLLTSEKLRRQEYQDALAVFEPSYHAAQQREAELRKLAERLSNCNSGNDYDEARDACATAILAILDGKENPPAPDQR